MNWFKFDWFTSKEREELEQLRKEKEDRLSVIAYPSAGETTTVREERPYKNLYFSGDIITVVLRDGSLISKKADKATFDLVRDVNSEAEVLELLSEQEAKAEDTKETAKEREIVSSNLSILRSHPEFEVKGDKVFLKGVTLELPAVVTATFIQLCEKIDKVDVPGDVTEEYIELDEQYEALKMFWIKLALNGLEQSREDLLRFVKENDVRITRNGNLVLYRRIVTTGDKNKKLVEFVSQEYYKIKRWKKSPKNYTVWKKGSDYVTGLVGDDVQGDEIVGSLYDLYVDLPNMQENTYTSWNNRGKLEIKIGSIYNIPDDEINLDNGLCAAGGLHAAAVDYDYSSFGDTPVVVLVNPSKAITVPTYEWKKLRTTEMFIAAINDKPHGVHFDEDALSAFDEEYNNLTIKELEDAIRDKSFKPASVEDNVSPITFTDLETIKEMLKGRIKQVQL